MSAEWTAEHLPGIDEETLAKYNDPQTLDILEVIAVEAGFEWPENLRDPDQAESIKEPLGSYGLRFATEQALMCGSARSTLNIISRNPAITMVGAEHDLVRSFMSGYIFGIGAARRQLRVNALDEIPVLDDAPEYGVEVVTDADPGDEDDNPLHQGI